MRGGGPLCGGGPLRGGGSLRGGNLRNAMVSMDGVFKASLFAASDTAAEKHSGAKAANVKTAIFRHSFFIVSAPLCEDFYVYRTRTTAH